MSRTIHWQVITLW